MDTFDFIVVGAGAAGSALAYRLSEDPAVSVLVLEAGTSEVPENVRVPYGWPKLFHSDVDWDYKSVPQKHLNDRQLHEPEGKLIGGSSDFYHQIHIRGHRLDYDNWAYNGCPGWSWEDVLPYFQKLENQVDDTNPTAGKGGPLDVFPAQKANPNPASAAFLEGCAEMGYPRTDDFNGPNMLGAGWHHLNFRDGRRFGSLSAYLEPALERPNVTLSARSLAARLVMEGQRCVGVTYLQDGQLKEARASHEVILSAGAIQSPKLLMLSGIGAPEQLRQLDIPVVVDLPGVGENFQNHVLVVGPVLKCAEELPPPHINLSECCLFWKSDASMPVPDLQIGFVHAPWEIVPGLTDKSLVTMLPGLVRVFSRGSVRLASTDPEAHPLVDPNYLSDPSDLDRLIRCFEVGREIAASPAFKALGAFEVYPGPDVKGRDQLEQFMRSNADSYWHFAGSCKMGTDRLSVVDPHLRVRGVEGLRVADGSVMPALPSGNCHAGIVMIAERAADFAKQTALGGKQAALAGA